METGTQSGSETKRIGLKYAVHHVEPLLINSTEDFSAHLKASNRIVALLGAGLSAPSGIPVFRGPDSSWRGIPTRDLADLFCLNKDPVLFWHFYNHRRHIALRAKPNPGHYALAKLAELKDCLAISQNIDGEKSH
jgi:NAD-dependent SIR2 family protein deacetylase